ncbi:MAG: rhomboid family intramembrane serine protease [Gemmatimonadota bacterium]
MFPLRDENPTELVPLFTVALIAANVAVWLFVQGAGASGPFLQSLCAYGTIPGEITGVLSPGEWVSLGPVRCRTGGLVEGTLITSMFLHGGWGHLIGNMWFLWVFGNNIEDSMGHFRFLLFYLLAGLIAAGAHILSVPGSGVPTVGASGAISGVMGAYLILYPRVRVYTLVIFVIFVRVFALPAFVLLGYWFVLQLFMGAAGGSMGGGVAFWAHVGGFLAGVVLVKPFARRLLVAAKRGRRKLTRDDIGRGWW